MSDCAQSIPAEDEGSIPFARSTVPPWERVVADRLHALLGRAITDVIAFQQGLDDDGVPGGDDELEVSAYVEAVVDEFRERCFEFLGEREGRPYLLGEPCAERLGGVQ